MIRKAAKFIFFGNYFLGFCIAALSFETLVQCGFSPLPFIYFALVLLFTVVYYTYAYTTELTFYSGSNTRTRWYVQNRSFIKQTQAVAIILIVAAGALFLHDYRRQLVIIPLIHWLYLTPFPVLAVLYYGVVLKPGRVFNLRRSGWLKPFVIGLVASGAVTVYPLILSSPAGPLKPVTPCAFFFMANFMFTSVIAIMFDIKDYAADHNRQLKTLVVHFGLHQTLYYLLLPFIGSGLIACLVFAHLKHYSNLQVVLLGLPFLLLAGVAWSLQYRKKILYYLAVIDGLLLVKAACGITAVFLFN